MVTKELISKLKELDCRVCLHLDCMTCIWTIVALFGTKVNPSLPLLLRDKPCQQNVFDCTSVVDQRAKLLQRFLPQQVMPRGSKNSELCPPSAATLMVTEASGWKNSSATNRTFLSVSYMGLVASRIFSLGKQISLSRADIGTDPS